MADPDAYTLINRLRIHISIIIQDVLEAYHARSLTHLRQLRAEVPSNIFLYISREINACPFVDNSTIDHFLHQEKKPTCLFNVCQDVYTAPYTNTGMQVD